MNKFMYLHYLFSYLRRVGLIVAAVGHCASGLEFETVNLGLNFSIYSLFDFFEFILTLIFTYTIL